MSSKLKKPATEESIPPYPSTTTVTAATKAAGAALGDVKTVESVQLNPPPLTMDSASEFILARLEPMQQSLILDLCHDNGRSPLDYIISYCKLAADRGELSFLIDRPDGAEAEGPVTDSQLAEQRLICGRMGCGIPFIPERRGQLYHSNECGQAAHQDLLREQISRRSYDAEAMQFAPPTSPLLMQQQAAAQRMPDEMSSLKAQVTALTKLIESKFSAAVNG